MAQYQQSPAYDDVDIGALLRAILNRKALIIVLMLGAGIATYMALQFVTPLYTSQARILIEYDEPSFMRPRSEERSADKRSLLDQEAVVSQVQVLLSRDLAKEVVNELSLTRKNEFIKLSGPSALIKETLISLGLAKPASQRTLEARTLDSFEKRLSVYQIEKSRVIAVDFDSHDPETAAAVPNALAKSYLTWQQREKLRQTKDATAWLTAQIDMLRKKVQESEAKVEQFRTSSGLFSGRNDEALDAQQLSELNSQIILAKAARTEAEVRANLITRMLKEKGDIGSSPDVLRSQLIQRLLEQRVRVRREVAELSATLLPSHPRIRQLRSELTDLDGQLRREAEKIVSSLRNEAQIAGAREKSLRSSLNDLKKETGQSSDDQIKLRALQREAKANRDLLESYLARYNEANARRDVSSVPAHASIITHAHVEDSPSFPKKGPISALVSIAVGLLTVASIAVKELVTVTHHRNGGSYPATYSVSHTAVRKEEDSVRSTGDETDVTDRPVVLNKEVEFEPAPEAAPTTPRPVSTAGSASDAARIIAARHQQGAHGGYIVTADSHDADTAPVALDTGRYLASHGLSVMVVDFTTTGTTVSNLAGIPGAPGIVELIAHAAGFEDVIRSDTASNLQIISAGGLDANAFGQMESASWTRINQVLGEIYDCVILHASLSAARRLIQLDPSGATTLVTLSSKADTDQAARNITDYVSPNDPSRVDVVIVSEVRAGAKPAMAEGYMEPAAAV